MKFQNCSEFNKHVDSICKYPQFMHVTNRIKSQLVGMKTVISANYACLKLTISNIA
jgi:hypothetical protein